MDTCVAGVGENCTVLSAAGKSMLGGYRVLPALLGALFGLGVVRRSWDQLQGSTYALASYCSILQYWYNISAGRGCNGLCVHNMCNTTHGALQGVRVQYADSIRRQQQCFKCAGGLYLSENIETTNQPATCARSVVVTDERTFVSN